MSTLAVSCPGGCARPLDYHATSDAHALNLLRKHYREYHAGEPVPGDDPPPVEPSPNDDGVPGQLNLSAAARWLVRLGELVEADEVPPATLTCATALWGFLLGMPDNEATALAADLATRPDPVYAYLPTL